VSDEQARYGLVMPFVIYMDQAEALAAGWDCGSLCAELKLCAAMPTGLGATPHGRYMKTAILPQADLIAMHHGYSITPGETDESGEWVWVDFHLTDVPLRADGGDDDA